MLVNYQNEYNYYQFDNSGGHLCQFKPKRLVLRCMEAGAFTVFLNELVKLKSNSINRLNVTLTA